MNTKLNEIVLKKIKKIMKQKGIKQNKLAEMIGVVPQNLNAYMTGKRRFGDKNLNRIAQALEVSIESLYTDTNVTAAEPKKGRRIPIISWVQAGAWHEAVDMYQPGYAEDWTSYDTKDEYSFALTVEGDSMEPEFRKGDVVIVSPSVDHQSGDYVIAKFGDDVTLKKLKVMDDTVLLKPLNPDYDDIIIRGGDRKNLRIVGKVIGKFVRY